MNRNIFSLLRTFLLLACLLIVGGCSVLKARPAKHAGFLPKPELVLEQRERAPFNGYWVIDPISFNELKKNGKQLYIAPIDTSIVNKSIQDAKGSKRIKSNRIEEAEELARYFRERLKLAFNARGDWQPKIVNNQGPNTLQLKLAFVQIIPTNPGINFAGTVAGFFVPGGGLIKFAGEGSIAMEGYISEEIPNTLLYEQYKDREGQKASAFSLKDYQRYEHIRVVIDDWSEQLAELFTTDPSHTVEDSDVISLNPL